MLEMIIKAARPNISDNSIKQYMSSLRTLNGGTSLSAAASWEENTRRLQTLTSYATRVDALLT